MVDPLPSQQPPGRKGYRGPGWLGAVGALTATGGFATALATWIVLQVRGDSLGLGLVKRVVGVDESSGDSEPVLLVLAFLAGFVVGGVGLCVLAIAVTWAIVRSEPRRQAATAWERAQPGIARGQQEWEKAKPRLSSAVDRGRRRLSDRGSPEDGGEPSDRGSPEDGAD